MGRHPECRRDRALAVICMKALSKNPGERYPSAQGRAKDIRLYRSLLPTSACCLWDFLRPGRETPIPWTEAQLNELMALREQVEGKLRETRGPGVPLPDWAKHARQIPSHRPKQPLRRKADSHGTGQVGRLPRAPAAPTGARSAAGATLCALQSAPKGRRSPSEHLHDAELAVGEREHRADAAHLA